jgi:hypothetical protein
LNRISASDTGAARARDFQDSRTYDYFHILHPPAAGRAFEDRAGTEPAPRLNGNLDRVLI